MAPLNGQEAGDVLSGGDHRPDHLVGVEHRVDHVAVPAAECLAQRILELGLGVLTRLPLRP